MIKESLAQLQKVDLREVWKSEPGDFRPWLADPGGLKLLGTLCPSLGPDSTARLSQGKSEIPAVCN